jgi:hypothetical protein
MVERKQSQLTKVTRERKVLMRKRRQRIADLMLQGEVSKMKLAAIVGVTTQTITTDMDWIWNYWLHEDIRKSSQHRSIAVRRQLLAMFEFYQSWQASKQSREQVTTQYIPRPCPKCEGKGRLKRPRLDDSLPQYAVCKTCDGTGKVIEAKVTRTMTGQAGDGSLLEGYAKCVRDIAKLQNLYPTPGGKRRSGPELHLHQHGPTNIDLSNLPTALLMETQDIFDKLRKSGVTVEVESVPEEALKLPGEAPDGDSE